MTKESVLLTDYLRENSRNFTKEEARSYQESVSRLFKFQKAKKVERLDYEEIRNLEAFLNENSHNQMPSRMTSLYRIMDKIRRMSA